MPPDASIPLSTRSANQLREEAQKFRRLAATARTVVALEGFLRLAVRLDALANERECATKEPHHRDCGAKPTA
jgi:hypothetical protein